MHIDHNSLQKQIRGSTLKEIAAKSELWSESKSPSKQRIYIKQVSMLDFGFYL